MSKLKMAVIGCGARGRHVIRQFTEASHGEAEIKVVYDHNPEAREKARKEWKMETLANAASLEEAVNNPEVNMVAVFTPNRYHCEAILAALAAKKKVFSEKPLATTLEDCERIIAAEKQSGISVMTGFVLRYSPVYRKVKELLDSGTFGQIINISADENRPAEQGGNSMSSELGWRRFRDQAGPYLLEKCSHDLDLLNWYAGCTPTRVASFCGLDYFIPKYSALWDKYDHETFSRPGYYPEETRINPFTSAKDIFDNHSLIIEYPNGIKMSFQLTLANAIGERRMYISCTEGTIIVNDETIRYRRYGDSHETTLRFITRGGHGGSDPVMAKEIMAAMLNGKSIAVSGSGNGLACAKVALAADISAQTGKIIDLH